MLMMTQFNKIRNYCFCQIAFEQLLLLLLVMLFCHIVLNMQLVIITSNTLCNGKYLHLTQICSELGSIPIIFATPARGALGRRCH